MNLLSIHRHPRFTRACLALIALASVASVAPGDPVSSADPGRPIREVEADWMGVVKWNDSNGDTGDPFWADDDRLHTFLCDGRGFGRQVMNLNFNRFDGPDWAGLTGTLVNPMAEYGKGNEKLADNATWKVCGQECIDGVFYGFVARNVYGKDNKGDALMRQSSFNASLIKSADHGRTWTRSAAENYAAPMWPGTRFGAPSFVHYGRNGGQVARDEADRFVYALSNNGFWNGGDDFILGRVERLLLPRLQAADWTYWAGEGNWTPDRERATPILSRPGRLGWTSPCYLAGPDRYLLVSWYVTPTLRKWFEPGEVIYDFLEAPHPWGPWTQVGSLSDRCLIDGHFYGPNVCAKFQEWDGRTGRVRMFTSGCPFPDKPDSLYKIWSLPLVVRTESAPPARFVNNNDPSIRYSGSWECYNRPERRYLQDDIQATRTVGDAVEFAFEGTGVAVVGERFRDLSPVEVEVDGVSRGLVRPALENFPRVVRVVVFEAAGLASGPHRIRLVNRGPDWMVVDGFKVTPTR